MTGQWRDMGIRQGVRSRCHCAVVPPRSNRDRICSHFFFFSSSPPANFPHDPPMCWTKRPVLAPGNTGCDTVCMRLAVGLAGGSRLECCRCSAAGDEAAAAGIGCPDTHACIGDRSLALSHTFLAGISSRAMQRLCRPCNSSTCKMPARSGASGRVPWGCPGIGWAQVRRTNSFADSDAPGSKIWPSRIIQFSSVLGH